MEDGKAKILVTSTQHDAVDNAIKQVSYSGVPVNRVFNRERAVNEDTPMFGWIDQMVNSCGAWLIQNKLGRRREINGYTEREKTGISE